MTKRTLNPGTGMQIPYTTSSLIFPWNTVTASMRLSGLKARSASDITSYRPETPTSALRACLSKMEIDLRFLLESFGFRDLESGFCRFESDSLGVKLSEGMLLGAPIDKRSSSKCLGPWGNCSLKINKLESI